MSIISPKPETIKAFGNHDGADTDDIHETATEFLELREFVIGSDLYRNANIEGKIYKTAEWKRPYTTVRKLCFSHL